MKTKHLLAAGILTLLAASTQAQTIYVANQFVGTVGKYDATTGAPITGWTSPDAPGEVTGVAISGNFLYVQYNSMVGKYNATTGGAINTTFITSGPPLEFGAGPAVSGNHLYVANQFVGTVGEYDATTGAAIAGWTSPSGLSDPGRLAVSGNRLYIANDYNHTVGVYNATTGAAINTNLVNGFSMWGLAVSGNYLYVVNAWNHTVGEYDAMTGVAINANLVSGLIQPAGLAISGNRLYVTDASNNTVGEYDATTGAAINANLITGLHGPIGLAITSQVPVQNVVLAWGQNAPFKLYGGWGAYFDGQGTTTAANVTQQYKTDVLSKVRQIFSESGITNINITDIPTPGATTVYFSDDSLSISGKTIGGVDRFNRRPNDKVVVFTNSTFNGHTSDDPYSTLTMLLQ